jgi:SAM-dependent methyltransferase
MADLPIDPTLPVEKRCRACDSPMVAYLRHVKMQRLPQSTPIYACLACGSFMHPQIYREPDEQLRADARWHVSVEDRNAAWARTLLDVAKARNPRLSAVVEVGCGTGTLLSVAKQDGLRVHGYDSNPHVRPIALERHGIAIDSGWWTGADPARHDLVVCISTLEHLTDPKALAMEIVRYVNRTGAEAFVSVPINSEPSAWPDYLDPDPKAGNPLYLCDVHLTHFTRKGFETLLRSVGATQFERATHGGWMGYWLSC